VSEVLVHKRGTIDIIITIVIVVLDVDIDVNSQRRIKMLGFDSISLLAWYRFIT